MRASKKIKVTSSYRIHKTIYHNDNYLLLFGKRNVLVEVLGISCE